MNDFSNKMAKALHEIDDIYGSIYQKMGNREKITYCELLLNTMYASLAKRTKDVRYNTSERTTEIISAAKAELLLLTNNTK